MDATNSDRTTAEFIYAIETGKIEGDIILVDKNDSPIKIDGNLNSIKLN
jgi:hypothetical protein